MAAGMMWYAHEAFISSICQILQVNRGTTEKDVIYSFMISVFRLEC
jgi:hypothetical protein